MKTKAKRRLLRKIEKNFGNMILAVLFFGIIAFYGWQERTQLFDFAKTMIQAESHEERTEVLGSLEATYQDNTFSEETMITMDGALYNLTGRVEMNDVVKLKNGHLTAVRPFSIANPENADAIVYMNEYLTERGIPFLFALSPYNICSYDKQLPEGYEDYTTEDANEFMQVLYDHDVPVLDFHEEMHAQGVDHYAGYYMTDHHWTTKTAFWAYKTLSERLMNDYGFDDIDPYYTDKANWEIDTYKRAFLGSKGKRTGIAFGGVDDFDLIYPAFDTEMTLTIPSEDLSRTGSFLDTQIFYDRIFAMGDPDATTEDDLFYLIAYDAYVGGVYPLAVHENPSAPSDKTILMIKDSYMSPVECYMSTMFKEVHCIDLRQFDGSIKQYMDQIDPDIVIVSYNAQMVTNSELFWFSYAE